MALVASTPKLGIVIQNVRRGEVLPTLLKRSGYHVYYRIDHSRSCIVVISVRHAQREPSRF